MNLYKNFIRSSGFLSFAYNGWSYLWKFIFIMFLSKVLPSIGVILLVGMVLFLMVKAYQEMTGDK